MNPIARLLLALVLLFQIRALAAPGDVDPGFVPPAFELNFTSNIYCTALQDDGRILIGGLFATTNSYPPFFLPRSGLARLLLDGSVDPNFEGSGEARGIAMPPDGKIVVAYVGVFQNFVTRLTPACSLDSTLNLEFTGNAHEVRSLVIQPDGKIILGTPRSFSRQSEPPATKSSCISVPFGRL